MVTSSPAEGVGNDQPDNPHNGGECASHNVLLEYGELPCVLPYAVHLDLGYCPDTQGYLGLLSGPYKPSHTLKKLWVVVVVVGWPKILVSAPVPLELI